jgi:hypothetical protein
VRTARDRADRDAVVDRNAVAIDLAGCHSNTDTDAVTAAGPGRR